MKAKGYLNSITYNWLNREGNVGHCSSPNEIAWLGDIEEEGAKWLARALRAKNSAFSSKEIWKGIFNFEDRSRRIKTSVHSRSGRMPRKKHRTEPLDSNQQKGWPSRFWGGCHSSVRERNMRSKPFGKDKYNLKLFFLLPFLNIGDYMPSEKERKKLKGFVS